MTDSQVMLAIDIDWAPDFMLDWVAGQLVDAGVKCTWFVTHHSPAVERLRAQSDLFELGIHPNFFPTSSQGKTVEEVMAFCRELVPDAVSMRTHSLMYSTPLLEQVLTLMPGIKNDVSTYMRMAPSLQPTMLYYPEIRIRRIPFLWEDDLEMNATAPVWALDEILDLEDGLKILNIHPIHIYMNASRMDNYNALKMQQADIAKLSPQQVEPYINTDTAGAQTVFLQAVEHLNQQGHAKTIKEIA